MVGKHHGRPLIAALASGACLIAASTTSSASTSALPHPNASSAAACASISASEAEFWSPRHAWTTAMEAMPRASCRAAQGQSSRSGRPSGHRLTRETGPALSRRFISPVRKIDQRINEALEGGDLAGLLGTIALRASPLAVLALCAVRVERIHGQRPTACRATPLLLRFRHAYLLCGTFLIQTHHHASLCIKSIPRWSLSASHLGRSRSEERS